MGVVLFVTWMTHHLVKVQSLVPMTTAEAFRGDIYDPFAIILLAEAWRWVVLHGPPSLCLSTQLHRVEACLAIG